MSNEDFTYTYSFAQSGNEVNRLEFYIKKINFKGDVVSFSPLTDQLTLCPMSLIEATSMKRFGQYFVKTCEVDPSRLVSNQEQYFYELFLKVADNQFLDVPVLVTNGE